VRTPRLSRPTWGHSSIQVTYDKYGHLMPGNEDQAAELLDAYLTRAKENAG
jgi:integrase